PDRSESAMHDRPFRIVAPWIGLLLCGIAGCGKGAAPVEEKAPPATVKWEGPAQLALEDWTELLGTTIPLPDRVARVTAPVEGRVQCVFCDAGSQPIAE